MVTTETSRLKLQTEKMLLHGICVRSQEQSSAVGSKNITFCNLVPRVSLQGRRKKRGPGNEVAHSVEALNFVPWLPS